MNTITKADIELSERLRKACLEKGIREPRFVAQDENSDWWHYKTMPEIEEINASRWLPSMLDGCFLSQSLENENWRETLMEFKKPTIEEGKRYWRRNGEIVKVINVSKTYFTTEDGHDYLRKTGEYYAVAETMIDLIAEYMESEPLASVLNRTCAECGQPLLKKG